MSDEATTPTEKGYPLSDHTVSVTPPKVVDINHNTPLAVLYMFGGILLGAGAITAVIATIIVGSELGGYSPSLVGVTNAMGWQAAGIYVAAFGALLLVAGMVAHAINWQIVKSTGIRS